MFRRLVTFRLSRLSEYSERHNLGAILLIDLEGSQSEIEEIDARDLIFRGIATVKRDGAKRFVVLKSQPAQPKVKQSSIDAYFGKRKYVYREQLPEIGKWCWALKSYREIAGTNDDWRTIQ